MFVLELAGVRIALDNRYPFVERQCQGYICEGTDAVFTVRVTDEEIAQEQTYGDYPAGYCESVCMYRQICTELPKYNAFLLHSSVIEVDGYAYAFAAKSGVGKSTHTALWLKNIPNARVLNGDKPLMRIMDDGSVIACGTPWNGKENWGINSSAPLAAVCFIERGEENRIRRAEETEMISRLVHQLYLRGERDMVSKQLTLIDAFVRNTPCYILACNISNEAAQLSYNTMRKQPEKGEE